MFFFLFKKTSKPFNERKTEINPKQNGKISVSFGLDLGFSCQGMQDITMFCLVRKQNLPPKLATWHIQIPVSLNEEHCAHWIFFFFAASINHVQLFPWIQTGFSSYAQEEIIRHISQQNHGCAQEHKSHDHFSGPSTSWTEPWEGLENPESITQPS